MGLTSIYASTGSGLPSRRARPWSRLGSTALGARRAQGLPRQGRGRALRRRRKSRMLVGQERLALPRTSTSARRGPARSPAARGLAKRWTKQPAPHRAPALVRGPAEFPLATALESSSIRRWMKRNTSAGTCLQCLRPARSTTRSVVGRHSRGRAGSSSPTFRGLPTLFSLLDVAPAASATQLFPPPHLPFLPRQASVHCDFATNECLLGVSP